MQKTQEVRSELWNCRDLARRHHHPAQRSRDQTRCGWMLSSTAFGSSSAPPSQRAHRSPVRRFSLHATRLCARRRVSPRPLPSRRKHVLPQLRAQLRPLPAQHEHHPPRWAGVDAPHKVHFDAPVSNLPRREEAPVSDLCTAWRTQSPRFAWEAAQQRRRGRRQV